ncbi:ferric uptake regulator, Fur family [Ammonifex degensii KC4]|uniref:Ferric uptake regulator, Fur family n=1 Tax=Ammonifex degensii (strain DSM 10501 / KC4) TaxID=429009 RepID=C9R8K2_AMMDK|nr:Fur family transcriptional regulator [Ammonifex degensii]ACX52631.1 ferric uptake regulator, Fur family [Ammonifex degensii KC4]
MERKKERREKRNERASKLRRLGLRATPQRLAILAFLEGNRNHPSAEEIYQALKPRFPSLSLATVYGTLEILEQSGEIQVLTIDPERRRFDPDPTPHAHFYCQLCGRVFDLPRVQPALEKLPEEIEGFWVEKVSLSAYGVCPACRKR